MQTAPTQQKLPLYRTIQGQLIIFFLAMGVIPLLIIGGVASINANSALRDSITNTLTGLANAKSSRLAAWLVDSGHAAEALAATAGVRGSDKVANVGVETISATRKNTEQQAVFQSAYDAALSSIVAFKDAYTRIDEVFLIDNAGTIVVSTNNGLIQEGTPVSQIPNINFQEGLKDTVVGDITLSVDGVTRIFVVVTPVIAPDGQVVGVIATRNNLGAINEVITDYTGLGDTGETYLVDIEDHLMRTVSRSINTVYDQPINTYPMQQLESGVLDGTGEYPDYRGVGVLGSWSMIEGSHWLLIAEIDLNEAFASANQLMNVILIVIVLSVIGILIVSAWVARGFSKPITTITAGAVQVADGALDVQVDVKSSNELGMLASAFNRMTENLRRMVQAERDTKNHLESTLTHYAAFIESVAHGNLKDKLHMNGNSADEEDDLVRLGHNLNTMVQNLRQMTSQIQETVAVLSSTAMEIQASTTEQTAAATEQDAAVTETVATVEEVRVTVQQTSERAKSVAQSSQQSVSVSRSGQETVTDTVRRMEVLRRQVDNIAENILMLSERTQQIGEIIDTVNGLAEQSKLLALNASIEAARAGEEGKGFAVVAMEVRQLAEQSREATSRVRQILSEIQQATNSAVMVTEEGSKEAETGMKMAENAGQVIRNLANTIEETAQAASQIAASTNQQTMGMSQLAQAMSQIKQAATQTAASTRQTEVSIRELSEMAKRLEQAVKGYTL